MKTKIASPPGDQLMGELVELARLTMAELKERWRSLYKTEPPPRIGRGLFTRAIAYRMQERVSGGLKPSTRRLLERLQGTVVPASDSTLRRLRRYRREPC